MNLSRFLASIPFFQAMKGYNGAALRKDIMAGLTIGMIAVPLSMALAINSGAPPESGLYTTIVAGLLIAICGGSRFNVSGPTAAFVIILQPITNQYGVGGLMLASFMAGIILMVMGFIRAGGMVHFVPHPVTAGFSTGIAVVIALTQLPDFFGYVPSEAATNFIMRMENIWIILQNISIADLGLGLLTLAGLIFLPYLLRGFPPHLVVLGIAALVGLVLEHYGIEFRTIYSEFQYEVGGEIKQGIPAKLPEFKAVWSLKDLDGNALFTLENIQALLPSAFVIAFLGAIESLLCAVVADGMKNTRHNPDVELIGQGIGNFVAPFFGGFAATGALARTAASIRAGAQTQIAAVVHAIFVLLVLVAFAKLLGYLPMASLAALLLMVAWSMADLRYLRQTILMAPTQDRIVLFTCIILTVVFDMVVAVMVGLGLSTFLFMARMTQLTQTQFLFDDPKQPEEDRHLGDEDSLDPDAVAALENKELAEDAPLVLHYEIRGPFFFGAARKAIESLERLPHINRTIEVMIIHLDAVPLIDLTGIITFKSMIERLHAKGIEVILSGLNNETKAVLGKAGLSPKYHDGVYWVENRPEAEALAKDLYSDATAEERLDEEELVEGDMLAEAEALLREENPADYPPEKEDAEKEKPR